MLKLGVNIDHVATVREARYRGQTQGEPCPVEAVRMAETAGAHGITAHLREDRRHIQDRDIWAIREAVTTRLNFEMANTAEMVDIAIRLKPEAVCLVPENRAEVTTEGGLDVVSQRDAITTAALQGRYDTVSELHWNAKHAMTPQQRAQQREPRYQVPQVQQRSQQQEPRYQVPQRLLRAHQQGPRPPRARGTPLVFPD